MIDRRVRVLGESAPDEREVTRISHLRDRAAYVLLGEPGIGKSTVFAEEAARDGTLIVPVRAAIHGFAEAGGDVLYLDGLDEYRVDGTEADKIYGVAKVIKERKPTRWRLNCRAEDWRSDADLNVLKMANGTAPVTVAQLLPLSADETIDVLIALGESDPEAFVAKARQVGAGGLLESPLSLKLLRTVVVKAGEWPTSRYELFKKATDQLSYEHNPNHAVRADRAPPSGIIVAADRLSLLTLSTGARGIWRSNAPPPTGPDREYLPANAVGLDPALIGDTLDTAIFTGDGTLFEPMHRSVAEFLAARALAAAVRGSDTCSAIPLGRVLALLAGPNGTVPSELRGIHAWLAPHLAAAGDMARARDVADNDPVGVLAYGDVSMLDHAARVRLFDRIDQDDPYFLGAVTIDQSTALGGLATNDMTSAFMTVLETPAETHKLALLFSVLEHGRPLVALRDRLRQVALDPERPEWQRERSISILLKDGPDRETAREEILGALAGEAASVVRETLRARLVAGKPAPLTVAEVKDLVRSFATSERDNRVMRLQPLRSRLASEPMPELFEVPVSDWLPDEDKRRQGLEVDLILDKALAAVIRADDGSDAERVWRWIGHARADSWELLEDKSAAAVGAWIAHSPDREARLFDAVVDGSDRGEVAWAPGRTWSILTGREVSAELVRHLLQRAQALGRPAGARLAEIGIAIAKTRGDADLYFESYAWAEKWGDPILLAQLTTTENDALNARQQASKRKHAAERTAAQQAFVTDVMAQLATVRDGTSLSLLDDLAHIHLKIGYTTTEVDGVTHVVDETSPEVAAAAISGFETVARAQVPVSPRRLGELEATGGVLDFELPLLAGIARLVESAPE